jgi:hypothetical protein
MCGCARVGKNGILFECLIKQPEQHLDPGTVPTEPHKANVPIDLKVGGEESWSVTARGRVILELGWLGWSVHGLPELPPLPFFTLPSIQPCCWWRWVTCMTASSHLAALTLLVLLCSCFFFPSDDTRQRIACDPAALIKAAEVEAQY